MLTEGETETFLSLSAVEDLLLLVRRLVSLDSDVSESKDLSDIFRFPLGLPGPSVSNYRRKRILKICQCICTTMYVCTYTCCTNISNLYKLCIVLLKAFL